MLVINHAKCLFFLLQEIVTLINMNMTDCDGTNESGTESEEVTIYVVILLKI